VLRRARWGVDGTTSARGTWRSRGKILHEAMQGELRALSCSHCGAPLTPEPDAAVITCAYCRQAHHFVSTSTVSAASARRPATGYATGDAVYIAWGARWWRGRILRPVAPDRWLVHYDGWDSSWDEEVAADRLAPHGDAPPPPLAAVKGSGRGLRIVLLAALAVAIAVVGIAWLGGGSPYPAVDVARTRPVAAATPLDPGQQVAIEWRNQGWPGSVVSLLPDGRVRVHYQGYSASHDEVVPRARLRAF